MEPALLPRHPSGQGREETMSDRETIKPVMMRIALFLVLALVAANSFAQDNRVVKQLNVLGSAVIHDKNLVDGRQNAVNDALVAAVGQVAMEMLTDETVVRRFQLINDSLLSERDKYVQNYRVLTESISGATVRTLVQVDIAVDRVSRDLSRLGLALAGTVYPRLLLMVAERSVGDAGFAYWWGDRRLQRRTICEEAAAAALQKTGFEIIDLPDLNSPLGLPVDASEADMVALAERLGADVLIAGNGTAVEAPNTMGGTLKAFEAVVEIRALNVKTGQPVGRTRQKAVVSGQDEVVGGRDALSGAGALAGDALSRQVMAAWQQDQDRRAVIEVAVEGTGGHIASFVRLRTTISSLSGVNELKMKEMSADRAVMAVSYQGSARSMADALLLNTFTNFGIDIFEVTPETIHIRLVHR
jgi:hypothetical protein